MADLAARPPARLSEQRRPCSCTIADRVDVSGDRTDATVRCDSHDLNSLRREMGSRRAHAVTSGSMGSSWLRLGSDGLHGLQRARERFRSSR